MLRVARRAPMAHAAAFAFLVTFLAAGVVSRQAAAADTPVPWRVDPNACPEWSTPLSRQIALACEAAGRACEISSDTSARRITLQCGETEHWTIEAHDAKGTGLWHIEVRGDTDERLRVAAVWVARSEGAIMAPEPGTVTVKTPPAAIPVASPSPSQEPKWGGLALGARVLYWPHDQARDGELFGYGLALRAFDPGEVVHFLPRSMTPYLSLAGELALGDGAVNQSNQKVWLLRLGAGVMWHVPHTKNVLGLSLEGGFGYMRSTHTVWQSGSTTGGYSNVGSDNVLAYMLFGPTVEAPVDWQFRPFASVLLGVVAPTTYTGLAVGALEIGCRWTAW